MLPDKFIGKHIGEFHIEQRIGRGGMATVYRASQPAVNRKVALKVIYPDIANTTEYEVFQKRFAQEAEVIARLEHIHILPIYSYGIEEGVAYLAMRLLNGGSLSEIILSERLTLDEIGNIFGQVAQGLAYAHSKGVIHRDLKPSNIMLDDAGNAYLTDFGLAKWLENSADLTKSGNIVGTPAYMSPEQLKGDAVDHRADIYSMGIILYHMIVGRPPFDTSSADIISIIYQHLEKEPQPPSEIVEGLPPQVEAVVLRALQKDPDERYADIRQMAYELDLALGHKSSISKYGSNPFIPEPVTTVNIRSSQIQPRIGRQRSLLMGGLASTLIILLIIVSVFLLTNANLNSVVMTPQVLAGETGNAEDFIPTAGEIAAAQRTLGSDGFIAYVTCNQSSEYHATQAREMGDFARSYGLSYRVYDSDTDEYAQITQIEKARTDGAKGFIICPLSPELLDQPLKSLQTSQFPLVLFTSSMPSYGGVMMVSVGDEYQLGHRVGEAAGQIVKDDMGGEAKVILLDYPELPAIVERANGMEEGLLEQAPDAEIVGRYLGATRENAESSVEKLLENEVDFDVILSINDAGSFGAIAALAAAGIDPDAVMIASMDAEQQALRYIQDGYFLRVTLDPGREPNSQASINAVVKQLAGAPIPETLFVPPGATITAETLTTSAG